MQGREIFGIFPYFGGKIRGKLTNTGERSGAMWPGSGYLDSGSGGTIWGNRVPHPGFFLLRTDGISLEDKQNGAGEIGENLCEQWNNKERKQFHSVFTAG